MSLPQKSAKQMSPWSVLIGALAGVAAGIFLGDEARLLRPVGDIYVMLLEVAVYPYLICSLLQGLGSMSPTSAWRLFRAAWPFYLGVWILTFGMLALLTLGIPESKPISLPPPGQTGDAANFLSLLIPANLFTALSKNYLPAVVVFAIFYGIAFQQLKDKQPILTILDGIRAASLRFWNWVVWLAPIGVFAFFAATAGTLRVRQLDAIGIYFLLFFSGVAVLSIWLLPWCIASLVPMKYREVMGEMRSALVLAVATSLPLSALPIITEATARLAQRCGIDDPESADVIRTNISVAYPLGQLGNFFILLFLSFAAFFYHSSITALDTVLLPFISLPSCFGSPTSTVEAVHFLGTWLGLPAGTEGLYVELMALTRYGQVIATVMGFAFLSFTVTLAYYGKVRIRWRGLLGTVSLGATFVILTAFFARAMFEKSLRGEPSPYLSYNLSSEDTFGIKALFDLPQQQSEAAGPAGETVFARIRRRGELRVGYNAGVIPFCYRNSSGDLVGYDIAFAYKLAHDMNVGLRFIPFDWINLEQDLISGKFDIAMAGIFVTEKRLARLAISNPYYQSPLALFTERPRAERFQSRESINSQSGVRIGVFDGPGLLPRVKESFPNAQLVIVPSYSELPDFKKVDAAIWSLEQAEALAAAHPALVAVRPSGAGNPFLFCYVMAPDAAELRGFVNYWLEMQNATGFSGRQQDYWIRRIPRQQDTPRWSILRNVLGFGAGE